MCFKLQFIWVDFVHQVKNKDGVVKMTVSNGLMKNNFSYATVMTMSSEVGFKTRYICWQKSILISRTKKRCPQILHDHHTMVENSFDLLEALINQ